MVYRRKSIKDFLREGGLIMYNILSLTDTQIALIVWIVLIVASIIVEMITEDLVIIWGTCGAVIAFVAALFKAEVWVQLLLFTLATMLFISSIGISSVNKRIISTFTVYHKTR